MSNYYKYSKFDLVELKYVKYYNYFNRLPKYDFDKIFNHYKSCVYYQNIQLKQLYLNKQPKLLKRPKYVNHH